MTTMSLGRRFDVITCLFSTIGYVKTYQNLAKTLRNFADHLRPGGLLLIEPWFTEEIDPVTFQRTANQDSRFVWRLRTEAGVKLFVDTTISIKHSHVFEIDESYSKRFADWEKA